MRLTLPLFRVPRRLASDVLAAVDSRLQADPAASAPRAFFAELPAVLQRFFQRYPPAPFRAYADKPRMVNDADANPFLANKHPVTGRWHEPRYSMRRQADLWKAAYRFGIEDLMPPLLHNRKFYEARYAQGLRVRGARLFKLRQGERAAPAREKEVSDAYQNLDQLIAERKGPRFVEKVRQKRVREPHP